jgi:hypothetical protein
MYKKLITIKSLRKYVKKTNKIEWKRMSYRNSETISILTQVKVRSWFQDQVESMRHNS